MRDLIPRASCIRNAFRRQRLVLVLVGFPGMLIIPGAGAAAELHAATIAAFDHYVAVTESQRSAGAPFLWIDGDALEQRGKRDLVRRGALLIERVETRDGGRQITIPDGLVHHWLGLVFVPGATLNQALALLQGYDRHADIYRPYVARSRLLSRNGDTFRVYLRFFMKKVITVVVNSEHEAEFTRDSAVAAHSRIVSTRIAEVDNPDTAEEREKIVGHDGGYLWRLNSYWRFLERDDGIYVQCESISLTRGVPFGLRWIVGPFVTSIPRETLSFTLETTRRALQGAV
jgi:hypothetical protein